jgi:hypothetical protein
MRGRFSFLNAGYVDELALAKARNPYYRENPPGVANERVELPVLCGLVDFVIYVFAIFPFALANDALFFLWVLTIPFAFLSAVMPVGPVSAIYWRKLRATQRPIAKQGLSEDHLISLRARRQWLEELAVESVKVEAELAKGLESAGDLRFAFEAQIKQAQDTRVLISAEIAKINAQLAVLELIS